MRRSSLDLLDLGVKMEAVKVALQDGLEFVGFGAVGLGQDQCSVVKPTSNKECPAA